MNLPSGRSSDLITGRRVAAGSLLNVIGFTAPLLVAAVAIPPLIRLAGTDRFAILTLSWSLVSYFSLLDMGLSRSLTHMVADHLGSGLSEGTARLVWTGMSLMLAAGLVAGVLMAALTPWAVSTALHIPESLHRETGRAFYWMAASLPLVMVSVGCRSVLDAHQRFDWVNAARIPLGVASFLAPLVAAWWVPEPLPAMMVLLLICRLMALALQAVGCFRLVPDLKTGFRFDRTLVRPLLTFGGWMSVVNMTGPLMVHSDRFVVGALLPMAAVAHYATPNEVVTKLWFLPWAVVGVLFPAFSTTWGRDPVQVRILYRGGLVATFAGLFPPVLILAAFSADILGPWLGPDFAASGGGVLRWMALGALCYGLSQIPQALIQGAGKPRWLAVLALVQVPVYYGVFVLVARRFGIEGAAVVWALRMLADMTAVFVLAGRLWPVAERPPTRERAVPAVVLAVSLLLAGGCGLIPDLAVRMSVLAVLVPSLILGAWRWGLSAPEKHLIGEWITAARRRFGTAPEDHSRRSRS